MFLSLLSLSYYLSYYSSFEKYMRSPHLPTFQWRPPKNWSGDVEDQGSLRGCSSWLCRQCRLSLLTTPTWVTSTISPSPTPPPHPYFYHYYLSLFLYPLTQCLLYLTMYLSLLSLTISPLPQLISYSVPSPLLSSPLLYSPIPNINVGLLVRHHFHHGREVGEWGFDNAKIANYHENTAHTNLHLILLCSLFSFMDEDNP